MAVVLILCAALIAVIASIAIYQSAKKQQAVSRTGVFREVGKVFSEMGWTNWSYAIHMLPEQGQRITRALESKTMKVLRLDKEAGTATVRGEAGQIYEITPQGCSCPDFQSRNMPCKHMYFALIHLGDFADQG